MSDTPAFQVLEILSAGTLSESASHVENGRCARAEVSIIECPFLVGGESRAVQAQLRAQE
jgi:hypothetical protein